MYIFSPPANDYIIPLSHSKRKCIKMFTVNKHLGGEKLFDFGMRLQQLRMNHNMSLADLGKKINRSKSAICGYENNYKTPPLEVLVQMAVIFNVSLDYLVGIDKTEMVSVDGLNDGQKEIIYGIIGEFKSAKSNCPGLSDTQQNLLNKVLVEFNKKHN